MSNKKTDNLYDIMHQINTIAWSYTFLASDYKMKWMVSILYDHTSWYLLFGMKWVNEFWEHADYMVTIIYLCFLCFKLRITIRRYI